jgi:hypothetical protein
MAVKKLKQQQQEWPDEVTFEDCTVLRETEKAILVEMEDGEEIWFPQSQISANSELWRAGQSGALVVSKWIAIQKELVK